MTELFEMFGGFIPGLVVAAFFIAANLYEWLKQ